MQRVGAETEPGAIEQPWEADRAGRTPLEKKEEPARKLARPNRRSRNAARRRCKPNPGNLLAPALRALAAEGTIAGSAFLNMPAERANPADRTNPVDRADPAAFGRDDRRALLAPARNCRSSPGLQTRARPGRGRTALKKSPCRGARIERRQHRNHCWREHAS